MNYVQYEALHNCLAESGMQNKCNFPVEYELRLGKWKHL